MVTLVVPSSKLEAAGVTPLLEGSIPGIKPTLFVTLESLALEESELNLFC